MTHFRNLIQTFYRYNYFTSTIICRATISIILLRVFVCATAQIVLLLLFVWRTTAQASRAADSYVRTHASYTLLHWPNRRQEQYHSSSNTRRTLPSAGSLPRRGAHHLIIQPTYHPRVDSIDHATSALQERRITKSDTSLKPFLEQAVRSHSWLVSIFQASHSSNKHSQINTKSHQRLPSPYLALPNSSRSPSWPSNSICSRKSSSQRMREHIISRFLPSSRPNPHQIFQTTFCYHVGLHGLGDRVCSLYHTSTNTTLCVCIKPATTKRTTYHDNLRHYLDQLLSPVNCHLWVSVPPGSLWRAPL